MRTDQRLSVAKSIKHFDDIGDHGFILSAGLRERIDIDQQLAELSRGRDLFQPINDKNIQCKYKMSKNW
jgi:hypothetical protein